MNGQKHSWRIQQSNLRHFRKRWNERYGESVGEFSRAIRRTILDKIYYGESRWIIDSRSWSGWLRLVAVPLNGHDVYVLYDETHHDLFSAIPPEDPQVRRFQNNTRYRRGHTSTGGTA